MRLQYHEALLLALAPPFPRLRWEAGFEVRTDTSLGEHLASLRAGSSSHRKSSQPGLLLLLSISSPATTVISLPHTSFWTSPPGLLLNGSSLVRLTPLTQHAVSLHTTEPIAPVGTLEECMGSAVQLPPISGTGNFIYNGTHIRAHITAQAHLGCNHLEPGYQDDILMKN
ncbi:hypothetical protein E2C01_028605 [Portunus trituberculatus]|uniref:Uncharacterized protein n=1 Tax=Portunus trituberculatus TaxID=210409 RepID=A0A5B7EPJ2_PORTR|nr:hypothetical protein [Portunus trituberculatus]